MKWTCADCKAENFIESLECFYCSLIEISKKTPVVDFQVKIETLEKELAALKVENKRYREALEFYAGKTKFGEWNGPHLHALDKFGNLCEDTAGPTMAQKALAEIEGEK